MMPIGWCGAAFQPTEPSSLSAYVGKITRNIALDKLRQKNSSKRGNGEVPVLLDELAECVSGADELVAGRTRRR